MIFHSECQLFHHWLEWRKNKKREKVVVGLWAAEEASLGPVEYQHVILPPKGAGGERCSVNPASRGALHSRNHVTQPFGRITRFKLPTWNGRASVSTPAHPTSPAKPTFNHLHALTWVTSPRYQARRFLVVNWSQFKQFIFILAFDVGQPENCSPKCTMTIDYKHLLWFRTKS